MVVKVKVLQLNKLNNTYFSSIICSALIYLRAAQVFALRGVGDGLGAATHDLKPYFLRKFSTTLSHNSVLKSVALIKVEAISMNSKNFLPLSYQIINEVNKYFVIDSTQGFIYPRDDFGLDVNTYNIQVYLKIEHFLS
jgi:hypothetical protein